MSAVPRLYALRGGIDPDHRLAGDELDAAFVIPTTVLELEGLRRFAEQQPREVDAVVGRAPLLTDHDELQW